MHSKNRPDILGGFQGDAVHENVLTRRFAQTPAIRKRAVFRSIDGGHAERAHKIRRTRFRNRAEHRETSTPRDVFFSKDR